MIVWHVAFFPKRPEHWWGKEFGHVSLFSLTDKTWTHLDLHRTAVDLQSFYAFDDVNDYLSYMLANATVLRFGPPLDEKSYFFQPMTCVSFVKHTLGIRSRALLPDQLFRTLTANYGAERIDESPKCPPRDNRTKASADPCRE